MRPAQKIVTFIPINDLHHSLQTLQRDNANDIPTSGAHGIATGVRSTVTSLESAISPISFILYAKVFAKKGFRDTRSPDSWDPLYLPIMTYPVDMPVISEVQIPL